VRLLLDTHVAIWAVSQSHLLPADIFSTLQKTPEDAFVSSVSIFEISVKHQLNKRHSPPFSGQQAIEYFSAVGFRFLQLAPEHGAAAGTLPLHHRDPFDRLLIAQAKTEPMHLVSKDAMVALYDCPLLSW
jgi:PIN domain nuclease of toxin-antitoxin system